MTDEIAAIVVLGVVLFIAVVIVMALACLVIKYRRQLSDFKQDGFHKPKYTVSDINSSLFSSVVTLSVLFGVAHS